MAAYAYAIITGFCGKQPLRKRVETNMKYRTPGKTGMKMSARF